MKAHWSACGARKIEWDQWIGKSKWGTTSKIYMIAWWPDEWIAFSITGGEVSDIKAGLQIVEEFDFSSYEYLVMDRWYSSYVMMDLCESKWVIAVVPPKTSFKKQWNYHKWIYAYRNEIERLFWRLKHYRRIATRFDKLKKRYESFIEIWLILRFLKIYVNSA